MKFRLAVIFLLAGIILISHSAKALELTCSNFTGQKSEDCSYITSSGLTYDEEQEALNAIWEQSYEYDGYVYNPTLSNETGIRLLLDKSTYIAGDKINIRIYPENTEITLTYGEAEISAVNQAELTANQTYSKITATNGQETREISFNVIEDSRIILAFKILFFGFFNYFIFSLTKSSFIVRWLIAGY